MKKLQLSSGDLVADRRADYAEMLAATGDPAAAAELMREALTLVPHWSGGWFRLGEMFEAAGRVSDAVDAWREALRLDADDRLGAALKLELAGAISGLGAVPSRFVETLFDQYADEFDRSLVERLGYSVPQRLAEAIAATGQASFAHAVDLGCGTGLMGERLRVMSSYLEGRDISAKMLVKAAAKGIYDALERGDLQTLEPPAGKVDLVTAADVFLYVGRLERVFATVAGMLLPGGVFAFSVERHDGAEDLVLRPSRRYAHSEAHIRELLRVNGFDLAGMENAVLRFDRGEPIEGLIVVAVRRAANAVVDVPLPVERDEAVQALH
ncbi:methyltransferase domain-containing protein [Aquamicrobium sp. LC103]|uniref:class I SAM-dependent DNA methyltransferase n=1 Tax=Aquamicrobium sp. LC103 TaxID=1120658 RepID=UPI00063E7930|nr:methyltransferase domain-containing protein [Aquamicrobium sp. LC103]TKT74240.1 methyltransferase domain-containing protein [Aquamicrobium sp. LC103]